MKKVLEQTATDAVRELPEESMSHFGPFRTAPDVKVTSKGLRVVYFSTKPKENRGQPVAYRAVRKDNSYKSRQPFWVIEVEDEDATGVKKWSEVVKVWEGADVSLSGRGVCFGLLAALLETVA